MDNKKIEEILEEMWIQREKGSFSLERLISSTQEKITQNDILEIEKAGYIKKGKALTVGRQVSVKFSEKGEILASQVIRGHRLAERLMTDVLAISPHQIESNACNFEHIIHHELADAICTLLGHPKECPHGRSIPLGSCCAKANSNLESVVMPLSKLFAGSRSKVAYITSTHYHRLDRLASLGILPGAEIILHQTKPSYVLQVGHTQIALDGDILKDIYVRKLV
ncbi:MAG TPA: DtxR family iron (metal) dependent repressor [Candidatus Omnitrophica bacterium]|nr:DtxR family iron (metal) dependent repressor [Candidatus Omnitrophota bacterium]